MSKEQHDDRELQTLLKNLRADPPDDGFRAQLRARLLSAGAPESVSILDRVRMFMLQRPWSMVSIAAGLGAAGMYAALQWPPHMVAISTTAAVDPGERARKDALCGCQSATRAEVYGLPAGKVAVVQLEFAVDSDVDEAEFSVLLPAGLAFFSEGAALPARSFHWVAPLSAGDNQVPIAIVGQAPGRHRLTAIASVGGEVVIHEIILEVEEAA